MSPAASSPPVDFARTSGFARSLRRNQRHYLDSPAEAGWAFPPVLLSEDGVMESVSQGWRFLSIGWEADTTDVGGVNPWDVAPYRPPDHRRPPFLPVTTTHHVHQRGRQFQSANHLRSR